MTEPNTFDSLASEIDSLKVQTTKLGSDLGGLRAEFGEMRADIATMQVAVATLRTPTGESAIDVLIGLMSGFVAELKEARSEVKAVIEKHTLSLEAWTEIDRRLAADLALVIRGNLRAQEQMNRLERELFGEGEVLGFRGLLEFKFGRTEAKLDALASRWNARSRESIAVIGTVETGSKLRNDTSEVVLIAVIDPVGTFLIAIIDPFGTGLIARLDTLSTGLTASLDTFATELTTKLDTFETGLTARIDTVATGLNQEFGALRDEIRSLKRAVRYGAWGLGFLMLLVGVVAPIAITLGSNSRQDARNESFLRILRESGAVGQPRTNTGAPRRP